MFPGMHKSHIMNLMECHRNNPQVYWFKLPRENVLKNIGIAWTFDHKNIRCWDVISAAEKKNILQQSNYWPQTSE